MTLRDEITKKRKEFWRDSDSAQMGEELESIIDRIDDIEEIVINKEFDIVTRLSKIEDEIVNLNLRMDSVEFAADVVTTHGIIKVTSTPDPEPQEPFPGYNELIKEAIPVIRATIDEKKRELTKREHPEEVT